MRPGHRANADIQAIEDKLNRWPPERLDSAHHSRSSMCPSTVVRYSASACTRSSCSKALAMRSISAGLVPSALAVSRAVTVA